MSTSQDDSVSHWLNSLQAGERTSISRIWERYFHQMANLARKKLRHVPSRAADEEDVALSAFDSFCKGMEQGRFPDLRNRDDLWSLLAVLTLRKAINLIKSESTRKRGGDVTALTDDRILKELMDNEPPPDVTVAMNEECLALLDRLPDDRFRTLVLMKLEGRTNEECSQELSRTRATIQRMLNLVRHTWKQETIL